MKIKFGRSQRKSQWESFVHVFKVDGDMEGLLGLLVKDGDADYPTWRMETGSPYVRLYADTLAELKQMVRQEYEY